MITNRRRALLLAGSSLGVIALAACGQTPSQAFTSAANYITIAAAALAAFQPALALVPGAAPFVTTAQTVAPLVANLATQLAAAANSLSASSIMAQIETYVNTVLTAYAQLPTAVVAGIPPVVQQAVADLKIVVAAAEATLSMIPALAASLAAPDRDLAATRLAAFAAHPVGR